VSVSIALVKSSAGFLLWEWGYGQTSTGSSISKGETSHIVAPQRSPWPNATLNQIDRNIDILSLVKTIILAIEKEIFNPFW
jgi:hypothetical protein